MTRRRCTAVCVRMEGHDGPHFARGSVKPWDEGTSDPARILKLEQGMLVGSATEELSSLTQAVSGLIQQWRVTAQSPFANGSFNAAFDQCADDLDAALASARATTTEPDCAISLRTNTHKP